MNLKLILMFLFFSSIGIAQENYNKLYYLSVGTLAGTQIFDIYSSRGKYELNPWMRDHNKIFDSRRGVLVKTIFILSVVGVESLILRKKPHLKREMSWFNFGGSLATGGVAFHNLSVPREYK